MGNSDIKGLILILLIAGLMLASGYAQATGCTPGEHATIKHKWANGEFYKRASRMGERFLWTDWECDRLMAKILVEADKRANKICEAKK